MENMQENMQNMLSMKKICKICIPQLADVCCNFSTRPQWTAALRTAAIRPGPGGLGGGNRHGHDRPNLNGSLTVQWRTLEFPL